MGDLLLDLGDLAAVQRFETTGDATSLAVVMRHMIQRKHMAERDVAGVIHDRTVEANLLRERMRELEADLTVAESALTEDEDLEREVARIRAERAVKPDTSTNEGIKEFFDRI